jgi:peroxiredoxin
MRTGDLVADFSLTDDRGDTWRLGDHRDRPVLLIFHRHLM